MKKIITENETIIYPLLEETSEESDGDFCIVVGNNMTLINGYPVDEDDIENIIKGLEVAQDVVNGEIAFSPQLSRAEAAKQFGICAHGIVPGTECYICCPPEKSSISQA
jgi:hypothetical protein